MRMIRAIASLVLLSAGASRAQEPSVATGDFLIRTALAAKHCSYTLEQSPVDVENWEPPQERESILDKIARGDPGYVRAIKSLTGSIIPLSDTSRRIVVSLPEELRYSRWYGTLRLTKLDVSFEEELEGSAWIPTKFEMSTSYWLGKFRLGLTFNERYRLRDLNCSLRATK
jgi:hypothetical protein